MFLKNNFYKSYSKPKYIYIQLNKLLIKIISIYNNKP